MRAWRDVSVVTKVAVALLCIVLLFSLLIVGVQLHITAQRDTAKAINEAGLQRFHLQKMMTDVQRIGSGDLSRRSQLAATAERYDRTLTALIEGNESMGIPASPPAARARFESLRGEWEPFRERLAVVQSEPPDSQEFQRAVFYLEANAPTLIRSSDGAVTALQRASEAQIRRLQQLLVVILLGGIAAVTATGFGLQRSVFRPLARITEDAQTIAAGDLDHEITTGVAEDEVGRMTRAVQEMKEQLSAALQEARNYQHAVDHAGLAVFLTDLDGVIQYVNPAFERITGYSAAEAEGETPRILKSGDHDEAFYAELWATIQSGDIWQREIVDQRKSGELFIADQTIAPVTDDGGSITGYVSILRDVTDRKQGVQYRQALERVLRHNLRNEVNVIDGHARLLREEVEAAETPGSIERVIGSADNLIALAEKSQAISALLDQPKQEMPIGAVVDQATVYCRHSHPEASVEVARDVGESVPVDSRVELALIELCDNAIVHAEETAPTVTIAVTPNESREGWIDVSVRDRGPGVPDDERAVIESQEETPLAHGSGLGLWLVHLAVTSVGGLTTFADNEPRGTVVTMSIPAATESSTVTTSNLEGANDEPS